MPYILLVLIYLNGIVFTQVHLLCSSKIKSQSNTVFVGMIGEKITFDSAKREFTYNKKANVFVSGDGGYSWIMVSFILVYLYLGQ